MQLFKKVVQSNTALVMVDQGIYSGTNFILTLFLAKQLSVVDFGIYSTVLIITFLALSLTSAVIIQPFQVYIAQVFENEAYYSFLFFSFLFVLILFAIGFYLTSLFINLISIEPHWAIFFILTYLFQDFFRKLFLGIGKIKMVLSIDIVFLILVVFGFYLFFSNINLSETLIIISLANLLSSLIGLAFLIIYFAKPIRWKRYLKFHLEQSKWLLSVALLQWSSSNFFVLISGVYLGLEALGAFRLVQSFFGILNVVLQAVENFYLPKIATLYHQNVLEAKTYLKKIASFGGLFFGGVLLVLFLFASQIIVFAGGIQYEKYAFVVRFMAVLYILIFFSYPIRILVRVQLLNKVFFMGYLFSFLFSLVSFHLLLQFFDLSGAVIGLILNQLLMMLYWQSQLKKTSH